MCKLAAAMWAGGAGVGFMLAALPQPSEGSSALLVAVSSASALIALLLRFGAKRLPRWALPAAAAMATFIASR